MASGQNTRNGKPRASSGVMRLGKMPWAGWTSPLRNTSVAPSNTGSSSRLSPRVPRLTGDTIDWWPWSYSVITVPRVSRLGPTVFGWIVRAWYTSRNASARIFQLQPSSTCLTSITRNGAAATSGRSRGSGSSQSSSDPASGSRLTKCQPPHASQRTGGQPSLALVEIDEVALVRAPARAVRAGRSSTSGTGRSACGRCRNSPRTTGAPRWRHAL